jgi:hypothetical protein
VASLFFPIVGAGRVELSITVLNPLSDDDGLSAYYQFDHVGEAYADALCRIDTLRSQGFVIEPCANGWIASDDRDDREIFIAIDPLQFSRN